MAEKREPIITPGHAGDLYMMVKIAYEDLVMMREKKRPQGEVEDLARKLWMLLEMWLGLKPIPMWPPEEGEKPPWKTGSARAQ